MQNEGTWRIGTFQTNEVGRQDRSESVKSDLALFVPLDQEFSFNSLNLFLGDDARRRMNDWSCVTVIGLPYLKRTLTFFVQGRISPWTMMLPRYSTDWRPIDTCATESCFEVTFAHSNFALIDENLGLSR